MRPLRPVGKKPENNVRFALLLFQVQSPGIMLSMQ